jgi:GNAT superfamily N-acetyltransferase
VLTVGDLVGSVVPAARSRSLPNSAVAPYDARLEESALTTLSERYLGAGAEAWGVWIHDSNHASRTALAQTGYALDSRPAAMAIALSSLSPRPAPPGVHVEQTDDIALLAEPLSAGYDFPSRFITVGLPGLLDHCQAWVARVDGTPAAALLIVTHQEDAGVFMVATAPALRGRGAASYALTTALFDAKQRGYTTSTLQSSMMGRPVYAALGYRALGAYELWEQRPGEQSPA